METQTLTQIAQRIEELMSYKDNLNQSQKQTDNIFVIESSKEVPMEGISGYACNLSDCKEELIPALLKVINKKIDDLKAKMSDLMYPLRQV
jgi:hypothetical protein